MCACTQTLDEASRRRELAGASQLAMQAVKGINIILALQQQKVTLLSLLHQV